MQSKPIVSSNLCIVPPFTKKKLVIIIYYQLKIKLEFLVSCAVQFHDIIERNNVLTIPTKLVNDYLNDNQTIHKIALIVNHIFRAISTLFFMLALPFSAPVNAGVCLATSLFYRLTVENNCAYKFAIPSVLGSITFPIAQKALAAVINKTAFVSISAFFTTLGSFIPVTAYLTYVILTVSYDVERNSLGLNPEQHCTNCEH